MKNLVIFDIETTGVNKDKDYIIQFSAIEVDMEANKIINTFDTYIQPVGNYTIEIAAYFVHHISAEFLKDKPHFVDVADKIIEFMKGKNILTYNGLSFDIPFLKNELKRVGKENELDFTKVKCYDAFLIETRRHGNHLCDVFKRYVGKTMDEAGLSAHNSLSDIKATYAIFKHQNMEEQCEPEVMFGEDNVIKMIEFQGTIQPCFFIGKYRQIAVEFVAKIDQGYLKWAVSESCNFSKGTKEYIKQFIND